jgi:multiple sugar transport system permease protein
MSNPFTTPTSPDTSTEPLVYTAVAKETAPRATEHEPAYEPVAAAEPTRAWGSIAVYVTLFIGAGILIVPFIWMIAASLSTAGTVAAGETLPMIQSAVTEHRFENYPQALRDMGMRMDLNGDGSIGFLEVIRTRFPALSNTIVITVLCILGQVVSSSLVGFGFARFNFRGRPFLFLLMLSTMMLPYQVTMIPLFLMFRWAGMIDTFWPLILPQWFASPFFAFMFRQFFSQVPEELMEAARIDGASHWTVYWRLMLPLSVIAIVAIFTFMTTWNDFLAPLIYLNSPDNQTLALALNAFNGQYGVTSANLLMAASFVAMLPCILLFFAAQRYFVESAASTGLKG